MFEEVDQVVISVLQNSLRSIRHLLDYSTMELAALTGLSERELHLVEQKKLALGKTKAIAILAAIEHICSLNTSVKQAVIQELCHNAAELECDDKFFTGENLSTVLFHNDTEEKLPDYEECPNSLWSSEDGLDYNCLADIYKIIIDDSVLIEPANQVFMAPLTEQMELFDNHYIVPLKVVNLLKESYNNGNQQSLDFIRALREKQLLDLRDCDNDSTLTAIMVSVLAKLKNRMRLALVTQNDKLAQQISALNCAEVGGFDIILLTCRDGSLQAWTPEAPHEAITDIDAAPESAESQSSSDIFVESQDIGTFEDLGQNQESNIETAFENEQTDWSELS